jgi:hypothetical protein
MKKNWTAGLTPQHAEEITHSFNAGVELRKRLSRLLEDKITAKRKETISKDAYASPSWAYLQADAVGYERALNEVISLISSETVEKT